MAATVCVRQRSDRRCFASLTVVVAVRHDGNFVAAAAAGADAEADAEAGAGRGQKRRQSEQPLQNDVFGNRREKGRREEITTRTIDHKRLLDHSADSEDTQYAGHPVPGFGSAPSPW